MVFDEFGGILIVDDCGEWILSMGEEKGLPEVISWLVKVAEGALSSRRSR
jgi:hypothetical protein